MVFVAANTLVNPSIISCESKSIFEVKWRWKRMEDMIVSYLSILL